MAKTITHKNNQALLGDKNHLEVSEEKSFTELIFEVLSERAPTPLEHRVFNLILNLSIDHGSDAPSAKATIKSKKKPMGEAIADGIAEINDSHGGAIEPCMEILYDVKNKNLDVTKIVDDFLNKKKFFPGLGHRLYKEIDPRTELIFRTLVETNIGLEYLGIMRSIRDEYAKRGKILAINIDGAIAAALCGFGWESRLGKAVFITARTPGLCAHFLNNQKVKKQI